MAIGGWASNGAMERNRDALDEVLLMVVVGDRWSYEGNGGRKRVAAREVSKRESGGERQMEREKTKKKKLNYGLGEWGRCQFLVSGYLPTPG